MKRVSIIGAGRVGGALALALDSSGFKIDTIVLRGERNLALLKDRLGPETKFLSRIAAQISDVDCVIVATGDPDIRAAAESVARLEKVPPVALHTSGSLSSTELDPLVRRGVSTASLHPLAAVSEPLSGVERFRDSYFCIEGDAPAVEFAKQIATAVGGCPFSIPIGSKPLYHAAAVMSAGHIVALLDAAIEVMTACGLSADQSRQVLLPLAAGSVENLSEAAPGKALTGPYARGDASALDRHLAAFEAAGIDSEVREIYLDLAARSTEIMTAQGHEMKDLRENLRIAKQNAGC